MITIIIIIILATVAINFAFGNNGLITRAEQARDFYANDTKYTEESMSNVSSYLDGMLPGGSEGETTPPEEEEPQKSEVQIAKENGTVFDEKTPITDGKNNTIMVPAGFKIASDSGDTVQQGIVIEDVSASTDVAVQGSQYVWIPVGTFKKDDDTTSNEIKLGRYTFSTSFPGTPTLQQDAVNYTASTVIESYFTESSTYDEGNESTEIGVVANATAKDLKGFIDSVNANGGYYIGRYEASYASGSSVSDYKAASKVSDVCSISSMSYNKGTLWNFITQPTASKVAINTYADSSSVKSDLMNSYAWDTAIVYIQEAGHTNYANQSKNTGGLANTGTNDDEVCRINDMASNVAEWTTEHSSLTDGSNDYPCVNRGGNFENSTYCTSYRGDDFVNGINIIGLRVMLYM